MTRLEQERKVVQEMQRQAGWSEGQIALYQDVQEAMLRSCGGIDKNGELIPGVHLGAGL